METTNFGAAATLLFVAVPVLFLVGTFLVTGEGEKSFVAGADIKEFIGLDDQISKSFCE